MSHSSVVRFECQFMPAAPVPPNETLRLSALRDASILNTAGEPAFEKIVRRAAKAADTPIALISFISDKHQWVKASIGLDVREASRDSAFCAWAIHSAEVMWVEDATEDQRFSDNPLVHSDPNIRHYAGVPISTPEGYLIGTICVIDRVPRPHDPDVAEELRKLSTRVSEVLRRRKAREQGRRLAPETAV